MLTESMETVPSSYEDSALFLDQAEDFGFIGEEDLDGGGEEEFERVENEDNSLEPHTISRHGSVDGDDTNSQNQEDELASTGILILGPSQMTTTVRARRVAATLDRATLSPRLSLPDTEYLPTDLQSLHLDSIHSSASSIVGEDSLEDRRNRRKHAEHTEHTTSYVYFYGLVFLCIFICTTVSLLAERRSWFHTNQKLEDQMKRMQADWVNLASRYEMEQEASIETSRSIKATLQAQMEEQRRIIEDLYREQRELKKKNEQEKAERERRSKEEKAKQRAQRQEQARQRTSTTPPMSKNTNNFAKKKPASGKESDNAKTFDIYWTDTEEAILKWTDETQHRLRTMLNGLSKKVWKVQANFFENADRTFQHVRTKIVQAWSDFYAAVHQQEGFMEKAAPLVSTVLFATAAAALTEGTNRFVRYMQDDEE